MQNHRTRDYKNAIDDAPEIVPNATISDLFAAIEWLGNFDCEGDDESLLSLAAVIKFLESEISQRQMDALVRKVAKTYADQQGTKVTPALMRAARIAVRKK